MQVVYATEIPPKTLTSSMFLAGPSPRNPEHPNWRIEAVKALEEMGYEGVVFIPLSRDGEWSHSYDDQVEWEETYLNMADLVVFWVPRDLESLPALTTNVEFGKWYDSGKAVLGYPPHAEKMRYLAYDANQEAIPLYDTLEGTLRYAVNRLGSGAKRTGGEREVPLHIWQLPHFQNWYQAQKSAGNRLDGAKLLWGFRVGPTKAFTFAYALHVDVHIADEDRNKINEFIISRPDIATIVAYRKPEGYAWHHEVGDLLDVQVVLIREFRSPARTEDGFIREIPGGSSWRPGEDPLVTMAHELEEETGLTIDDPSRFRKIGARQVAGTLSTHQAHVFAIELVEWEMEYLKREQAQQVVHGNIEDSERTYVEIHRLGDLESGSAVDWSMLGMIFSAMLLKDDG